MSEKKTIWQRLTKVLNSDSNPMGTDFRAEQPLLGNEPSYEASLLTAQSQQELELKRLEAQQNKYIADQYASISSDRYRQSVYYETTRYGSYIDFEAMEYSLHGDTKIATPSGFTTIKELADKGREYEFIVYAYDHNLKRVVPALAKNAHYTRDEMTYKIIFDDDSFIIATYGHRLLKRNGVFVEVENLKPGDSMMPFYRKSFYKNQKYHWVYTMNYDVANNGWESEHKLIAEWFYDKKIQENEEVHHIDFCPTNNMPHNLKIMDMHEHRSYHAKIHNKKLWNNPEYREKMLLILKSKENKYRWNGQREGNKNPSYIPINFSSIIEAAKKDSTLNGSASILGVSYRKIQNEIISNGFKNWFDFLKFYNIPKKRELVNKHIPWDLIILAANDNKTLYNTSLSLNISVSRLRTILKINGYSSWGIFLEAYGIEQSKAGRYKKKIIENEIILNHKIKTIEPYGIVPVYDITVPGYKNFATDTIFSHNTPEIATALDMMSEESCTLHDNGKMLNIRSNSERIKKILEDLFYNRIDINSNLQAWTRNTPVRENSIIPLLNGENLTIKEISERLKNNPDNEIWTYSIQDNTHMMVPGKIIWCDLTRENSELYRVTLDDGTYIDTTADHEYMLRDGSYCRADKLIHGQSLMPFYTSISKEANNIKGYEKVFNPESKKYEFTHRIVAKELLIKKGEESKVNDIPELSNNKKFLKGYAISKGKTKILNHKVFSVEKLDETSNVYCMEVVGKNGEQDRHNFAICSHRADNEIIRNGVFLSNCKYGDNFVYIKSNPKKGITKVVQLKNIEIKRIEGNGINGDERVKFEWKQENLEFNDWQIGHFRLIGDDKKLPYGTSVLEKARKIWKMMCLAEDAMMVYRLSRAPERRVFKIFVGNLDPDDIESHVQKIASKFKRVTQVNQTNGQIDLRQNILTQDQDYFIPVFNDTNGTVIDTLPGAQNLSEIGDIEFIQNKLFAALRVPKTFLNFAEAAGDGKNLAMQDVRFARTINKIQQAMLQELNKIAIIHLYLLGFYEDLNNFSLSLANPSSQADMLKQELWSAKFDNYAKAVADAGNGWAPYSMSKAKKEILGMSDEEIVHDLQQQVIERAEAIRNSPEVLQTRNLNSGIFDTLYNKYADKSSQNQIPSGQTQGQGMGSELGGSGGFGGGGTPNFGGGNIGGLEPDFGNENEPSNLGGLNPTGSSPENFGGNPEEEKPGNLTENSGKILDRNSNINKIISEARKNIDGLLNN